MERFIRVEIELRPDQVQKLEEIYSRYGIPPEAIISVAITRFIEKWCAPRSIPSSLVFSKLVHPVVELKRRQEGDG
jgi:RecA-family ATPase